MIEGVCWVLWTVTGTPGHAAVLRDKLIKLVEIILVRVCEVLSVFAFLALSVVNNA